MAKIDRLLSAQSNQDKENILRTSPVMTHDSIKVISILPLEDVQLILDHPTYCPHPFLSKYVSTVSDDTFALLMSSDKMVLEDDFLTRLICHNHPNKLKIYLASARFVTPLPHQVQDLVDCFSGFHYTMSILLADPRVDLSLISHVIIRLWVDQNETLLIDVLKSRLPDVITPMIERKEKRQAEIRRHRPSSLFEMEF